MRKLSLNNKGFGLTGVLIIIVAVAVVGGTGAYLYHQDHKANAAATVSNSTSSKTSTQTIKSNTTSASVSGQYSSSDALNLVQSTYTTALTYVKQTTRADQGEINAVKSNLSTDLYSKLSSNVANVDHDQILCGQMRPDSFTTSVASTNGDVVTVLVNEVFGNTTSKVTTTVDLSSLKITAITCP